MTFSWLSHKSLITFLWLWPSRHHLTLSRHHLTPSWHHLKTSQHHLTPSRHYVSPSWYNLSLFNMAFAWKASHGLVATHSGRDRVTSNWTDKNRHVCNWMRAWLSMTLSWLFHDFFMTFSWLSHEFLMNFSWLSLDFLMTCSWLSELAMVCAVLALVILVPTV